jgi:membrane-associated phospholipid phosphatase
VVPVEPNPNGYRPLLAQQARGPAVAVIMLAVSVVALLGMRYADQDTAGHLDRGLDALMVSLLSGDQPIAQALASLGNPAQATLLITVVAGAAAAAKRWSGVLLVIVGTLTAAAITELILKPLIGRLRFGNLAFPSGHTTAVAAIAIAAAILISGARWPRSLALRTLASLTVAAIAAGVAISLVVQDIHYATDTVAGYCVALATVLTVALCLDYLGPRIRRGTPVARTMASPDGG